MFKSFLPVVSGGTVEEKANGIDISAWQGWPDWQKVKAAGLSFAFIKSSEGNGYAANYQQQWDGAGSIGLLRSCYHYHHGEVNGVVQADFFMKNAKRGELPPVVDFEDADTLMLTTITGAAMMENLRICLERVESVWGVRPIIYTGQWFLFRCFQESPEYDARWMAKYPLWIANYTLDPKIEPQRPSWWPWTFYQYSSSGSVPGIVGRVDMNVFKGTVAELKAWAGVGPEKPALTLESLDARVTELEAKIK